MAGVVVSNSSNNARKIFLRDRGILFGAATPFKCMNWVTFLLIGTLTGALLLSNHYSRQPPISFDAPPSDRQQQQQQQQEEKSLTTAPHLQLPPHYYHIIPLAIPQGKAVALPSILIPPNETTNEIDRHFYGGKGDKLHLGGFTEIDLDGISPSTWKDMVTWYGIRSIMDVGCGRGTSTTWFLTHGMDALCIEGSHDARQRTMLPHPDTQMVEHDYYSRGPWWPEKTYDAVWCVEFLEHVGRNFHQNYIPTFRKAAIIFATHSRWGGWHHVEVHKDDWWILKFESYGFKYSDVLTKRIRDAAGRETEHASNGKFYNAQHIRYNMQVFINPMVASLPEHAHLFAEPGCFEDYGRKNNGTETDFSVSITRDCGSTKGESPLPENFKPLPLTPEMDQAWENILKQNIDMGTKEEKK